MSDGSLTRLFTAPGPVDLARTWMLGSRPRDPTTRRDGGWWRACRLEAGLATVRIARRRDGRVRADAWGPGREAALEHVPGWLGWEDDPSAFVPRHRVLKEAVRKNPGLRLPRGWPIFEVLLRTVLEQRVKGEEANESWRCLTRAYGEDAPGPRRMRVAPGPAQLAGLSLPRFHRFGVEGSRATAILEVMNHRRFVLEALTLAPAEAVRHLRKLPGIGPWTAMTVVALTHGWPDAVPVGDYHIPHNVAFALAGEPRADDRRMLELLEPYRGQRYRVIRLLGAEAKRAPARGPRRATFATHVALASAKYERKGS